MSFPEYLLATLDSPEFQLIILMLLGVFVLGIAVASLIIMVVTISDRYISAWILVVYIPVLFVWLWIGVSFVNWLGLIWGTHT